MQVELKQADSSGQLRMLQDNQSDMRQHVIELAGFDLSVCAAVHAAPKPRRGAHVYDVLQ